VCFLGVGVDSSLTSNVDPTASLDASAELDEDEVEEVDNWTFF
jgi:hypothetical protein